MLTTNPHLYRTMAFDPLKDFTPITQVALNPLWLVVRAGLPVNTVPEFVAYLKAHPNTVTYSTAGNGSALHMAQAEFARATGVTARQIPYKGAGQALQDVIAGQVDFTWDPGPALQHRSSGKIRIIAVGMPKRSSAAPDVPTVAESGYPGLNTASAHALLAPAGTPQDIVNRLNKAAVEIWAIPTSRSDPRHGHRAHRQYARAGGCRYPAGVRALQATDTRGQHQRRVGLRAAGRARTVPGQILNASNVSGANRSSGASSFFDSPP